MPHIIVEYSASLYPRIPTLLAELHETLAAQGVPKERIKTRAHKIDHAVVGESGTEGAMLHATVLLLEGRDIPTRRKFGDALYAVLKASTGEDTAVTLEMRDMLKDTYYL